MCSMLASFDEDSFEEIRSSGAEVAGMSATHLYCCPLPTICVVFTVTEAFIIRYENDDNPTVDKTYLSLTHAHRT